MAFTGTRMQASPDGAKRSSSLRKPNDLRAKGGHNRSRPGLGTPKTRAKEEREAHAPGSTLLQGKRAASIKFAQGRSPLVVAKAQDTPPLARRHAEVSPQPYPMWSCLTDDQEEVVCLEDEGYPGQLSSGSSQSHSFTEAAARDPSREELMQLVMAQQREIHDLQERLRRPLPDRHQQPWSQHQRQRFDMSGPNLLQRPVQPTKVATPKQPAMIVAPPRAPTSPTCDLEETDEPCTVGALLQGQGEASALATLKACAELARAAADSAVADVDSAPCAQPCAFHGGRQAPHPPNPPPPFTHPGGAHILPTILSMGEEEEEQAQMQLLEFAEPILEGLVPNGSCDQCWQGFRAPPQSADDSSDCDSRSGSAAAAEEEFEPPGSATVPASNTTGAASTQRSDERPREAPVAASPPRAPSVPPPRRTAEASRGGCQRARSLEAGREVPAASPGFRTQEAVQPRPLSKVPTINVPPMVTMVQQSQPTPAQNTPSSMSRSHTCQSPLSRSRACGLGRCRGGSPTPSPKSKSSSSGHVRSTFPFASSTPRVGWPTQSQVYSTPLYHIPQQPRPFALTPHKPAVAQSFVRGAPNGGLTATVQPPLFQAQGGAGQRRASPGTAEAQLDIWPDTHV